ncbi:hypothetical protein [Reichenbachiella ulvae]|uniref:Uncharacterized protein n=1 Tax=Reichenbachiella ulvae TaxID=2980104 RepID=A0ABT3D0F8_9BACT|nr:hypothetical protein [Reichenbachiella ulvae]MCV9389436.1 hypothetical protein [Reichenbachiella ulvae]
MKTAIYLVLSFVLLAAPVDLSKLVYKALYSGSLEDIEVALSKLNSEEDSPLIRAYKAALYAKEADKLKGVADKVQAFKKGAMMLEEEIKAYPDNVEFRFLRLAIQEKSPAILGYQDNIEEDKQKIIENYSSLDGRLKKQISQFATRSKYLKPEDLPQ